MSSLYNIYLKALLKSQRQQLEALKQKLKDHSITEKAFYGQASNIPRLQKIDPDLYEKVKDLI